MTTDAHERPTLLSIEKGDDRSPSAGAKAKALVFSDPGSRRLLGYIERLAPSDMPMLLIGETGTGKELMARHIHQLSGRKGPFLAVNCGAISDQLAESELFGHEAGSFTGAVGRREGWFEAADGGTLFLDEVGDLPLPLQVKLLRVLQEREVVRVGSRKSIAVDVRLVAATSVDLEHAVSVGSFRRDLFFRLNTALAQLPPLRDRPGDILPLAQHFLRTYCSRANQPLSTLSPAAVEAMHRHPWPGNIRELENVIHFAVLMSSGTEIGPEHLRVAGGWAVASQDASDWKGGEPTAAVRSLAPRASNSPLDQIVEHLRRFFEDPGESLFDDLEHLIVKEAYRHCGGNQVQSAALLGVSRNVLRTLLKRYGLLRNAVFTVNRTGDHQWPAEGPGH